MKPTPSGYVWLSWALQAIKEKDLSSIDRFGIALPYLVAFCPELSEQDLLACCIKAGITIDEDMELAINRIAGAKILAIEVDTIVKPDSEAYKSGEDDPVLRLYRQSVHEDAIELLKKMGM